MIGRVSLSRIGFRRDVYKRQLDVHTDALVRSRLAEVCADATVIVVAQRISTIIGADQIIVVEDGRVLGTGTHESLLANSPTYREFAESQSLAAQVGGPR